jgi:Tol biopolymer transport system component
LVLTISRRGLERAFESERTGDRDIYLMQADGTGVVNLTNSPGDDGEPSWR